MPVHTVMSNDDLPHHQALAAALAEFEKRERIVSVTPAGNGWVVVTEKKAGRPPKETRVSGPKETR